MNYFYLVILGLISLFGFNILLFGFTYGLEPVLSFIRFTGVQDSFLRTFFLIFLILRCYVVQYRIQPIISKYFIQLLYRKLQHRY